MFWRYDVRSYRKLRKSFSFSAFVHTCYKFLDIRQIFRFQIRRWFLFCFSTSTKIFFMIYQRNQALSLISSELDDCFRLCQKKKKNVRKVGNLFRVIDLIFFCIIAQKVFFKWWLQFLEACIAVINSSLASSDSTLVFKWTSKQMLNTYGAYELCFPFPDKLELCTHVDWIER